MGIKSAAGSLVRRAARPFTQRLVPWMEIRLGRPHERLLAIEANQIPVLERRLTQIEAGLRQHLPSLLNAVSSVAAFGYELSAMRREIAALQSDAASKQQNIGELWHRLEFVRKEIMYEMTYSATDRPGDDNTVASVRPPQIVAGDKVAAARKSGIKVNLGCGHIPLANYINVDQRNLPDVDIVADVGNLPFDQESVQEISSAHLLEHFPQERLRRLLPYWRSLLATQGVFRAIVPDGEAMLSGIANGTYPFEQFREVLFGAQEYNGDFHFNLMTPDSLAELLGEAGFKEIKVPVRARRNGNCFEFEISAARG
jgi:predicted SAM-dependent methyltransferase